MSDPLVLEVTNNATFIVHGELGSELYQSFRRHLGWRPEGWKYAVRQHAQKVEAQARAIGLSQEEIQKRVEIAKKWDGYHSTVCYNRGHCNCYTTKPYTHFPTGLLSNARTFFKKWAIPYSIDDKRPERPQHTFDYDMSPKFEWRDYQKDAIQKACDVERGIIKCATGGGKTGISAGIIAKLGVPKFIFYVTSIDLLIQARDEIQKFVTLAGTPVKVGAVGGGYKDLQDITVMTVQTAIRALDAKYESFDDEDKIEDVDLAGIKDDVKRAIQTCDGFISDECVTGDTQVITKDGVCTIKDLKGNIGKEILSFDGNSAVWKRVTHYYNKGKKRILKIVLQNGLMIRCTSNHPIMTQRGWVPAGDITVDDQVLCYVNVDANQKSTYKEEVQADIQNIYSDTKSSVGQGRNGSLNSSEHHSKRRCVNVDVKSVPSYTTEQSNHLTEAVLIIASEYILKGLAEKRLNSSQDGSARSMEKQQSINTKDVTASYQYCKTLEKQSPHLLLPSCRKACDINFVGVKSIGDYGEEEVFDITVEDTHCFFGNGLLVHNCQHWAARTCQVIADASEKAYFRYGLSATPWRDMGDDLLIDACFGRPIVDISASFLIKQGYLIQPEIYFLHVDNMKDCPYSSYAKIYQHALKENPLRNEWIAKLAMKYYQAGRLPLILVKHIDHGKLLQKMIPDSVFVHGGISGKKRKQHLDLMRERKSPITLSTNIFDEGVDIKPLDTILLAGSGKSQTRALQRIGRILRPWPDITNNVKKSVVAVDFWDHVDYLDEHSAKRMKIYQNEPEFKIKELRL